MKQLPVLITTDKDKRGVFFAHIDQEEFDRISSQEEGESLNLIGTDIQMCVYWSEDVCGVLGLAATGPSKSCRITKPVKRGVIKGITFVAECSPEAVEAWKKQPWKD